MDKEAMCDTQAEPVEELVPATVNTEGDKDLESHGCGKKIIITFAVIIIIIIGLFILAGQWNSIMAEKSCKAGDYSKAIQYYNKDLDKDKHLSDKERIQYNAIAAYLSATQALKNDSMSALSDYIDILMSTNSRYPKEAEINYLKLQYNQRVSEINSYDKSIEEIAELFSDTSKINDIKTKCDELLKKNITAAQKNKLNDIKVNVTNYIDIKSSYDKGDYETVLKKALELPNTYQSYATKDLIDDMVHEAMEMREERERIDKSMKSARESFNSGDFYGALTTAKDLLEMNLTEEERKEVESIKATSEQKVAEEKAAAEQKEQEERAAAEQRAKEARQQRIDNAIRISAASLYEAFTTNKVGADEKYKGKPLIVTGKIYQIDTVWIFGDPIMYLMAGYTVDGVKAYFSSDKSSQLTDLKQGQTIKVLGTCSGRSSFGYVTLQDCEIIG